MARARAPTTKPTATTSPTSPKRRRCATARTAPELHICAAGGAFPSRVDPVCPYSPRAHTQGKEKAARPEKRKRSAFIDEEAEHSDEEELDDDEEGEEEGDVMGEMLARGEDLLPDQVAARQNQALDADRRKREEAELEKQVKQRYESGAAASRYAEDGDDEEESHRFKHLPDAQRDPKLWLIKCKPNQEKRIIIALMQKFLDAKESGTPLSISSALCTDIKGYVYIEAFRESHVRTATQGLNDLYYRVEQVCLFDRPL